MQQRIALATCAALPDLDPDEQLLVEPLGELGVAAEPAIWDDPGVDWTAYDLVVIRSTWDYTERRADFLSWARSVPRLVNPADIVEWNTDKRYLADLAATGLPVVPTVWIEPGATFELPSVGVHVLKPAVGAGSINAARFTLHAAHEAELARAHAERLLAARQTVMVQPYQHAVDEQGEASLIFLAGEFSHAITKGAMLADEGDVVRGIYKAEVIRPRDPAAAELALAMAALAAVPSPAGRLVYARVDLVPGADGSPLLIELELTEPSLFLGTAPGSAARLAHVLRDIVRRQT